MRDNQRQSVRVTRANVDEVNIHAVDVCREMWQRVELRLRLTPVVIGAPITNELLQLCQLHPLRLIRDRFLIGPARCRYPAAQVDEILFRNFHFERSNGVIAGLWRIALSIARREQSMAEREYDDRNHKIAN